MVIAYRAAEGAARKVLPLSEEGDCIWLCLDCRRRVASVLQYRGDYGPDMPAQRLEAAAAGPPWCWLSD